MDLRTRQCAERPHRVPRSPAHLWPRASRARPAQLRGSLQGGAPAPVVRARRSRRAFAASLRGVSARHAPAGRVGRWHPRVRRRRGMRARVGAEMFVVARNPQEDSRLPYVLRLPLEGGIALKARDRWPAIARVYCHRFEQAWPADAELVEQTPVLLCRRRGAAIDLVLDRPPQARSQFVFTQVKGREAIFWQTQKTHRAANPGARIPRRRTLAIR